MKIGTIAVACMVMIGCDHGGDTHQEGNYYEWYGEFTNPSCIEMLPSGTIYTCVEYTDQYPHCVEVTLGECRAIYCDMPACYRLVTDGAQCENSASFLATSDTNGWDSILPCD